MDLLKLMAVAGSGFVMLVVVELIRRGRLKERYSLPGFLQAQCC